MPRWTKGEPYPENWPEWLKKADIEWCDVSVDSSGNVTWKNGSWHNGIWRGGAWLKGAWLNGTWESGTWHSGSWYDGNWYDGLWYDGTWHSGNWLNGNWYGGTWNSGVWHRGNWGGGNWASKSKVLPGSQTLRLSNRLRYDQTRGIIYRDYVVELTDLPPELHLEYNVLRYWVSLVEASEESGLAVSVWEHLTRD